MTVDLCTSCGEIAHNFDREEALNCIPPREVLRFGSIHIDEIYRDSLYEEFPFYTTEEVVGSYLGHNPNFPSYDEWLDESTTDTSSESFSDVSSSEESSSE